MYLPYCMQYAFSIFRTDYGPSHTINRTKLPAAHNRPCPGTPGGSLHEWVTLRNHAEPDHRPNDISDLEDRILQKTRALLCGGLYGRLHHETVSEQRIRQYCVMVWAVIRTNMMLSWGGPR